MGAQTRPAGLALFGTAYWDVHDQGAVDVDIGPGLAVYFYWYELQSTQRLALLDDFVVATLWSRPATSAGSTRWHEAASSWRR